VIVHIPSPGELVLNVSAWNRNGYFIDLRGVNERLAEVG
jgi:hypothetical protein